MSSGFLGAVGDAVSSIASTVGGLFSPEKKDFLRYCAEPVDKDDAPKVTGELLLEGGKNK